MLYVPPGCHRNEAHRCKEMLEPLHGSWQRAGMAPAAGMLCPSVNMGLPSLADTTERILLPGPGCIS